MNLPVISTQVTPTEVRKAFEQLRIFFATMQQQGGFISQADIIRSGIGLPDGTGGLIPGVPSGLDMVYPAPPALTGLVVTGGFNSIFLQWDNQIFGGKAYAEVWRAEVDDLGQAVKIGDTTAFVYQDTPPESSMSVTYYYWARYVNVNGLEGPFNAVAGTAGNTANDPAYFMELLLGQLGYEDGIFPVRSVDALPVLPAALYPPECMVWLRPNGPLYWNVGNVWTAKIPAGTIDGQITTLQIANLAITDLKIAANAVTETKIADDSISSPKITANAVTSDKIYANAVIADKIATNAVTAVKILANAVTADKIYANAVTADKIATNAVTSDKILANAVTSAKILAGSIIAGKLAAGAIVAGDGVISNAAIGTAHIINAAITNAKIGDVAADKITAGTITAALSIYGPLIYGGQINLGSFVGYAWPTNGGGGAHLSANGLLVGNNNLGKYFQITPDGNVYAPQFNIVNGNATFAGSLSAASGTFAGSLSAATINAINVNTSTINGEAVSQVAAYYNGGETARSGSSFEVVGLVVNTVNNPVVLTFNGYAVASSIGTTAPGVVQIRRNGTAIYTRTSDPINYRVDATFTDSPGTGAITYSLWVIDSANQYNWLAGFSFTITTAKRVSVSLS